MIFFDKLEAGITNIPPRRRRRIAIQIFFWSAVALVVNLTLYLMRIVDQAFMIVVTLVLSWLAITITAADLVATTDVREETE